MVTFVLVASFLNPPGLGDDATYWRLADRAMKKGLDVFNTSGFHPLRWPVWGLCYLSMKLSGIGIHNYYFVPFFYLTLGSLFAFFVTWKLTAKTTIAWLASILFVMHPLLNTISYRPMPDLSEGLFVGLAFWLCIKWVIIDHPRPIHWFLGLASGLTIGLAHSNRFTGLLIVPILGITILMLYPRRIARLLPVLLGLAIFYAIEGLVFQSATGNFWHSFAANTGAKGKKGTDEIPLWELPTRFLDTLWNVADMEPFFFLAAIGGSVLCWKYGTKYHRALVLWAFWLYMAYSCAIQSLNPIQPMLRDGARFLSSLALPMSILGAIGVIWGLQFVFRKLPAKFHPQASFWKPLGWVALLTILVTCTERTFTHTGYMGDVVAQINKLPAGSTVATHDHFQATAKMMSGPSFEKLNWISEVDILTPGEIDVSQADAIMFCRKQMWLRRRKLLENKEEPADNSFASFIQTPWKDWTLVKTVLETGNSDYAFLKRRTPEDKPAQVFDKTNWPEELKALNFTVPYKETGASKKQTTRQIQIPADWRDKHVWVNIKGSSDFYSPLNNVRLTWFNAEGKEILRHSESLYFHDRTGLDFIAMHIPAEAVRLDIRFDRSGKSKRFQIEDLIIYRQD